MSPARPILTIILLPALAALPAGCDKLPDLPRLGGQPPVELADQAASAGDYPKAVRYYEAALDGTSKTAPVHFKLAIIYDSHLKDPASAIHHYRRFLRLSSQDTQQTQRKDAERAIERLQRELAARLGEGGLISRTEALRLRNENNSLRQQLAALRNEKTSAPHTQPPPTDRKGFSTVPQTRKAEAAVGPETRTYTVQKGDTLASISRKFYNTPARWKDIADANHNQLGGSTSIREGQVLIIP